MLMRAKTVGCAVLLGALASTPLLAKPGVSSKKRPTQKTAEDKERDACRLQINYSGVFELDLTSVPHNVGGAPQCKTTPTGKKMRHTYSVAHDVRTQTAKVENLGNKDVIIREVTVVEAPASDRCKELKESAGHAAGIKWKEFWPMDEQSTAAGLQWTFLGSVTFDVDAKPLMTVVGILTRRDDSIVCYMYLDTDR
jgi:hypothetical protein